MEDESALELLRATHTFPCAFMFKVIGVAANDFEQRLIATVAKELDLEQVPYSVRETPRKKHVAVTLEPTINSAEQVLVVYQVIRTVDGVVMSM